MENIDVYDRHLSFAEKDGKMVVRKSKNSTSAECATAENNSVEYYTMYSRGSFRISFSAQNYSRTGAIARVQNLARAFLNVKLIAVYANGSKEKIWPWL